MGLLVVALVAALIAHRSSAGTGTPTPDQGAHNDLTDCRCPSPANFCGGDLAALSWHIHYTSNVSDLPRFYFAFMDQFRAYFPPPVANDSHMCPFGPNFAADDEAPYNYLCSLNNVERLLAGHRRLEGA
jgi:hypothetical protein